MSLAPLKRREFIALIGSASACSLTAHAQSIIPKIGFLDPRASAESFAEQMRGFHLGLKNTGYVAGENVAIEYR